jgi:hypothetical protein
MSKAESGRSSSGADSGAAPPPFAVAAELRATDELPATPLVAKELLDVTNEGLKKVTRGWVNESKSKFLARTWSIS